MSVHSQLSFYVQSNDI